MARDEDLAEVLLRARGALDAGAGEALEGVGAHCGWYSSVSWCFGVVVVVTRLRDHDASSSAL